MSDKITIQHLAKVLKDGWVYYDEEDGWWWSPVKPIIVMIEYPNGFDIWQAHDSVRIQNFCMKEIAPFDGDWQDSAMSITNGVMA